MSLRDVSIKYPNTLFLKPLKIFKTNWYRGVIEYAEFKNYIENVVKFPDFSAGSDFLILNVSLEVLSLQSVALAQIFIFNLI